MTFDDLEFGERLSGLSGSQALVFFSNGYGASVIRGYGSHGAEDELYELAVIKTTEDDSWDLCYDTEITNDVIGHLTEDGVTNLLEAIEVL
jgi:hypothetical protein